MSRPSSASAPRRARLLLPVLALIGGLVALPAPALASTGLLCTTDPGYEVCGRAFPDPQAGLGLDPHAEGAFPASNFIQFGLPGTGPSEIWDGLALLERRYDRFLEVWTLDELLDDPEARSAGLWTANQRVRSPLILARVTDEAVPAKDKARFVFALSLHGIERAGVEGGTRALEDLITYARCESLGGLGAAEADAICAQQTQVEHGSFAEGEGGFPARLLFWDADSLTMGAALQHAELYFAYVNPDGWHRGDLPAFGGIGHYQRYNGNGIDPNRDWPTEGYTYAPYTPGSEPETDAFSRALKGIGGRWAGGLDLHGQGVAPVLTYTMLPAGQNDYRKNARIRAVAQRTQQDAAARLGWSLLIEDGDGPSVADVPLFGPVVAMGPQQWGTVWDTIDYTITGAMGDWINNPDVGLGGLGMDNEMSLSHVYNCGVGSCFVPDVEQLHVAGNKGLIYSQIDTALRTLQADYRFPFRVRGAYLDHGRAVSSGGTKTAFANLRDLPAQESFASQIACAGINNGNFFEEETACTTDPFTVQGPADGIRNGGLTVDIGFAGTHTTNDEVGGESVLQRLERDHDGDEEWVDVARNNTAGQLYFPNGQTIAHNAPLPGSYRLWMRPATPGPYFFEVLFSADQAYTDPGQAPYDVTNLDFFDELNRYLPSSRHFDGIDADAIIEDPAVLNAYDVLVLPDVALPGWNHHAPGKSARSRAEHDAYFTALRRWVRDGGTLVLTDAALQGLADLTGDDDLAATRTRQFAGFVQFRNADGTTYDDRLANDINVPGAAEGSGNRRQTYEPVPLGFAIGDGFIPDSQNRAPVWTIESEAFTGAGGRVVGQADGDVAFGELPVGDGAVRVIGGLLPMPTEAADHPFGLASYALTWTGWQLFENLATVGVTERAPPVEPKVLSDTLEALPATGSGAGWAWGVFSIGLAAALARRLRWWRFA